MANKENNKLKDLIKEYGIKDMNDVHNFVKMLMAETIQTALDAELDEELGYSKYDYKNKNTKNSRNGYSTKIVQSSNGEMELKIPRDRDGDFEPQLVKKHQTDISTIEDKVIFAGFQKNPYPFIKHAKLMVVSSDFEGFSIAILEALALETAIISTDCPSGPNEVLPASHR